MAARFVDTNILIYAISPSTAEAEKRKTAQDLLIQGDLAVSVQVLQEFYYQVTRPTRADRLTSSQALKFLESLDSFPAQEITREVFHDAVKISHRYGISYWDGAILAAARIAGCDAVYSEDLSSEQDYQGMRVINPFA